MNSTQNENQPRKDKSKNQMGIRPPSAWYRLLANTNFFFLVYFRANVDVIFSSLFVKPSGEPLITNGNPESSKEERNRRCHLKPWTDHLHT